jgi:hypothetical protein
VRSVNADGTVVCGSVGDVRYVHYGAATCAAGFTPLYTGNVTTFTGTNEPLRLPSEPLCLDGTIAVDANSGHVMVSTQGRFEEDDSIGRTACAVCQRQPSGCYVHWGATSCAAGYAASVTGWLTQYGNSADASRGLSDPVCASYRVNTDPRTGHGSGGAQGLFNENQDTAAGWQCAICCAS